jgi:hypothetical protein
MECFAKPYAELFLDELYEILRVALAFSGNCESVGGVV